MKPQLISGMTHVTRKNFMMQLDKELWELLPSGIVYNVIKNNPDTWTAVLGQIINEESWATEDDIT